MALAPQDPRKKKTGSNIGAGLGAAGGAAAAFGAARMGGRGTVAAAGARSAYAGQRFLGSSRPQSLASSVRTAASGLKAKPLKIHKPSALAVGLGGGVGAGVGSSVGSKVSGPPKPQQMPLGPKKPKPAGAIAKSVHDAFIGKGVKPWK